MFGEEEEVKKPKSKKNDKKDLMATWTVGEETYRLKLTTSAIITLESRYKRNLITLISGDIPPLNVMLDIIHKSMLKFHHGIKERDVIALFDDYVEEGGSQTNLFTEVVMPILRVSGFFSNKANAELDDRLEEIQEKI